MSLTWLWDSTEEVPEVFTRLLDEDLDKCVDQLPSGLKNVMMSPDAAGKIFVAGGFIRSILRGEPVNDIDIYAATDELAKRLLRLGATIHRSEYATTLAQPSNAFSTFGSNVTKTSNVPMQVIKELYSDPIELIDSFDFSVCNAAIWREKNQWKSVISLYFYPDLASKRIRYTRKDADPAPARTLTRLIKYIQKGYNAAPDVVAEISFRAVKDTGAVSILTKEMSRPNELADNRGLIDMNSQSTDLADLFKK